MKIIGKEENHLTIDVQEYNLLHSPILWYISLSTSLTTGEFLSIPSLLKNPPITTLPTIQENTKNAKRSLTDFSYVSESLLTRGKNFYEKPTLYFSPLFFESIPLISRYIAARAGCVHNVICRYCAEPCGSREHVRWIKAKLMTHWGIRGGEYKAGEKMDRDFSLACASSPSARTRWGRC